MSSIKKAPDGRTLVMKGVVRESSSNFSSGRSRPTRPARATRWMMAFVDPPIAMLTRMAFSKASRVRMREGRRPSRAISTARRPLSSAMARRRESAAGMFAQPLSVMPRASARLVMVDAVPITMQWPALREMQLSISHHSSSLSRPARFSLQ